MPGIRNPCLLVIALALAAGCERQPEPTLTAAAPAATAAPALTLVHSARIYTFDLDDTLIEDGGFAFGESGRIEAIGTSTEMRAAFPQAAAVDLEGRTVLPGLIDAHAHLLGLAAGLTQANLVGTKSKADVLQRLEDFAASLGEGEWLLGHGWDQNDWDDQQFPARGDLDAAFPDRPVWLERIDGHAGWANSVALAAVDRNLDGDWNPPGGLIQRDPAGQPTGILVDAATLLVEQQVPPLAAERWQAAMDEAIALLLSHGLTGIHEAGLSAQDFERLEARLAAGRLPLRVYAMTDGLGALFDRACAAGGIADPAARLIVRAVKIYGDGALGSRGAALLTDYSDAPGSRGLTFQDDAAVREAFARVLACGMQVAIHAIGDGANRQALDAFAAVQPHFPHDPGRHRIEHAQVIAPADIPRFARLGVIASMQPTHATSDMYWAEQRLGPERVQGAYAWRALLDTGARLALGSDFPVEAVNPLLGIYAAVTRRDPGGWPEGGWFADQALTREEAVRGFTADAAYAAFMENSVGSLELGKQADFIVLDRNLMSIPPDEIPLVRVQETWVGGVRVFHRAIMPD